MKSLIRKSLANRCMPFGAEFGISSSSFESTRIKKGNELRNRYDEVFEWLGFWHKTFQLQLKSDWEHGVDGMG